MNLVIYGLMISQMMSTMEEQLFVRPFATLLLALTSCILLATTIVPFANLGSLADRSDALVMARVIGNYELSENGQTLFRYRLIVEESLKGSLEKGDEFDVQKWEKLSDERWITMWGDLNFYSNSNYLLFLEFKDENLYHPLCFSFYVFEEITKNGETFIVPSEEAQEFELVDINEAEPLYVYRKIPLLNQLAKYISGIESWSSEKAKTSIDPSTFISAGHKRSAPESCTFLTVNQRNLRWNNSVGQNIKIYYSGTDATGCSSSISQVQQSVVDMSGMYEGIEISYGGATAFTPNCSDATAVGPDFRAYMDDSLGGFRNVIIQFDDPCNEISNLTACGGILAIGGVYGVGTHSFSNETWATAKYGYIILNNGVGTCKCSNLKQILSHELTHSLGIGHISGSYGSANMNPDCCQPISSVDQTCVDYPYPPQGAGSLLPVELVSFEGISDHVINRLVWKTASEQNVEKFLIEKADNLDLIFEPVGEVPSLGNSTSGYNYQWNDIKPFSESYYRLRSIDLDGTQDLSNVIFIKRDEIEKPQIYPTAVNDYLNVRIPFTKDETTIQVFSVAGKQISNEKIAKDYSQIAVDFLSSGWYYLQIENKKYSEIFRFYKT